MPIGQEFGTPLLEVEVGKKYQHQKGGIYLVLGYSLDTESDVEKVLYQDVNSNRYFTRNVEEFVDGRFQRYFEKNKIKVKFYTVTDSKKDKLVFRGTWLELLDWGKRVAKKDRMNLAVCREIISKKGYSLDETTHVVSRDDFD